VFVLFEAHRWGMFRVLAIQLSPVVLFCTCYARL